MSGRVNSQIMVQHIFDASGIRDPTKRTAPLEKRARRGIHENNFSAPRCIKNFSS
jgi:hypothetical protein